MHHHPPLERRLFGIREEIHVHHSLGIKRLGLAGWGYPCFFWAPRKWKPNVWGQNTSDKFWESPILWNPLIILMNDVSSQTKIHVYQLLFCRLHCPKFPPSFDFKSGHNLIYFLLCCFFLETKYLCFFFNLIVTCFIFILLSPPSLSSFSKQIRLCCCLQKLLFNQKSRVLFYHIYKFSGIY